MPITLLSKDIFRSKYEDPGGAATPNDYIQFRFRVQNTTGEDIKSFDNTFIEVTKEGVTKQYIFKISVPAGTTSSLFTTVKYLLPEYFWTGSVSVKFIFPISASGGQNQLTTNFNGDWAKYYLGCTNPEALNYNPDADSNDGSCMLPVYGCTNPSAINYDPEATNDDGSCLLRTDIEILSLTIHLSTIKWNPSADYSGLIEADYYWAKNEVTIQNNTAGPLEFGELELYSSAIPGPGSFQVYHIFSSINQPNTGEIIPANSSRTIIFDTNFAGRPLIFRKSYTDTVSVRPVVRDYPRDAFYTDQFDVVFHGCTNPSATNYDDRATQDDSTCVLPEPDPILGCTDPAATNYNPNATQDDGSCTYTPPPVLIRTGNKGWATLEEYDILNYQLTGNEKDNEPGVVGIPNPDYVPPVYDPKNCPPGTQI